MQTTRPVKLMIVDDHAETRVLIRELIGRFAAEILECTNGKEAATQCAEFRPDLVTMDLNMPLTGGLEATRRIRTFEAEDESPRTPIVALTANATAEDREASLAAGMDGFLVKPLDRERLAAALAPADAAAFAA